MQKIDFELLNPMHIKYDHSKYTAPCWRIKPWMYAFTHVNTLKNFAVHSGYT